MEQYYLIKPQSSISLQTTLFPQTIHFQQNQTMNAFLNYSPTHLLDHKLEPIFQHIRTRKINNVHQLHFTDRQRQLHESPIVKEVNNLTLPAFNPRHQKIRKLQSLKAREPAQTVQELQRGAKETSHRGNGNQKIIFVSPDSKIKKHLVQSIDYKGIQKALYRKTHRKTLYQEFYQTMLWKDKWVKKTHPGFFQSLTIEPLNSINNSSETENPEQQTLDQRRQGGNLRREQSEWKKESLFRSIPKKITRRCVKAGEIRKSLVSQSRS